MVVDISKETLEKQTGPITEEQNAAIAEQVLEEERLAGMTDEEREVEGKKKKDEEAENAKEKEEGEEERKKEILEKDEKDLTEEEKEYKTKLIEEGKKTKEAELAKKKDAAAELEKERRVLLDTDDSKLTEEQLEKKGEYVKEEEEVKAKVKEEEDILVQDILGKEDNKFTEEQARESVTKDRAIVDKYERSPMKLAAGYRNLQSETDKTQNDLKKSQSELQDLQEKTEEENAKKRWTVGDVATKIQNGELLDEKGKPFSEEVVIEATKRNSPSVTKDMDDEAVLMYASERILNAHNKGLDKAIEEQAQKAVARRTELMSDFKEEDSEFKEIVEAVLGKTPDRVILREQFDLIDTIAWAKGMKYDELKADFDTKLKTAREEGYKKGKEEAEILGTKPPAGGGTPPGNTKKSKLARDLTEAEKRRAVEMFESAYDTEDEMYKAYLEIYPEEEPGINDVNK